MSEQGFDPSKYLTKVGQADKRRLPKSPEHRQKISDALKRYAATSDSHIRALRKSGPDHPQWTGGINAEYYQRVAYEAHGRKCNRCGSAERLRVHHINRNRRDSDPRNLEVLCHACHMKEHHGKRVEWACPACGEVLSLQPYLAARRKYCSRACKEASRGANGRFAA